MTRTTNKLLLLALPFFMGCATTRSYVMGNNLSRAYEETVTKIVLVSPYEKPVPTLTDVLEAIRSGRRLKKLPFKAGYRTGSGVIVSDDGLILTAAHVVRGSSLLRVNWHGRIFRAAVLARDRDHDMVVAKILSPDVRFPYARLGEPRPHGWPVYAIGHPAGMRNVITSGILSTIDEDQTVSDTYINKGSSGGGLFDATNDKLIGITVQIYLNYSASVQTKYILSFADKYINL